MEHMQYPVLARRAVRGLSAILLALGLAACGGSDSGGDTGTDTGSNDQPPAKPSVSLGFEPIKTFTFTWTDVTDATHYQLQQNPDGVSGYTQVGSDISQGTGTVSIVVPLHKRSNAEYILSACNDNGCTDSDPILVDSTFVDAIGYIKASNAETGDLFGGSEELLGGFDSHSRGVVKLSADGQTMVVGAYKEDGNGTDESDNSMTDSGAVYVFVRDGGNWTQQAYLKADNADPEDHFGGSLDISAGGNTIAVGAPWEDSSAQSINPGANAKADNSQSDAGAVYVFTRDASGNWSQQAYIKASDLNDYDELGSDVTLSNTGDRLVAGASGKGNYGFVYTFNRDSDGNWTEDADSLVPPGPGGDRFGQAVAISGDGQTLAVGQETPQNTISNYGKVHVYTRGSGIWNDTAHFTADNNDAYDNFATDVQLSDDGTTLAVGAYGEGSNGTGINSGTQANNDADDAGAVYVYTSADRTNWSEQAYIKASNTDGADRFGIALDLSGLGDTLVVGARRESSTGTGVNPGSQTSNGDVGSGAVYVFKRSAEAWQQTDFIKASNTNGGDKFGFSVAISDDTDTLAVGAHREDSNGTGVDSETQSNNDATSSGAVYVY
ncbi:MAG: hypothetical protein R3270_06175 [Gammaproteobacteria bacterium]|nr:hypothetical protein [Gammaproteobacteria bacterium]